MDNWLIIGAGNGGKAAAADLALQNKNVRLYEDHKFSQNLDEVKATRSLYASGEYVQGEAKLDMVTTDLNEAFNDGKVQCIMVCTQVLAHEFIANDLYQYVKPHHIVVLNPGSTGGTLHFAHIWRSKGMVKLPILVELGTLTYGCRASGQHVNIALKAKRVHYSTLPANAINNVKELEVLFPGLKSVSSVMTAAFSNANPVIHPSITLLNAGRIENEGHNMKFYADGVSPMVAKLIQKLDNERMALNKALGYDDYITDPEMSVAQGYAESTDYYECYKFGKVFGTFSCPDSIDNHRYFHEDIGVGLVFYCMLGAQLNVPTPVSQAVVSMGSMLMERDYMRDNNLRTPHVLGLDKLSQQQLKLYLDTGAYPL